MLKQYDFKVIDQETQFYKFNELKLEKDISQTIWLYKTRQNQQIYVSKLNSMKQLKILDHLLKINVINCIKGFAKFHNDLFCFSSLTNFKNIQQIVKQNNNLAYVFTQQKCNKILQGILIILNQLEKLGLSISFLNPKDIIIQKLYAQPNSIKLTLAYPLTSSLFRKCTKHQIQANYQFCSPEQLKSIEKQQTFHTKQFKKSILYSLGLIIIYCFGYILTKQIRQNALINPKQLAKYFKGIRSEIKIIHQSQFISKSIKLLLQNSEAVRDTLKIFQMKLFSKQFQSLKKKIIPIPAQNAYLITQNSDRKDNNNCMTIQIKITHNSLSNTQKSENLQASLKNTKTQKDDRTNDTSQLKIQNNTKQVLPNSPVNSPVNIHIPQQEDQQQQNNYDFKSIKKQDININDQFQQQQQNKGVQQVEIIYGSNIQQENTYQNKQNELNKQKINEYQTQLFLCLNQQNRQLVGQKKPQRNILRKSFQIKSKIIMVIIVALYLIYGLCDLFLN